MGSSLLVYGCLVFLVAETELPLALDSVLEEQSLPPQHSLSPSFPDSKQGEAMQSAANRQTGKESPGVHGSHAPLADADHTSHSAHSVPSPSSHSRNQVLRFLSAVNLRARVAKKKKKSHLSLKKVLWTPRRGLGTAGQKLGNSTLAT